MDGRPYITLRFWEKDIYNDLETIKQYIITLVSEDNNAKIKSTISEIKKYYSEKS